MKRIDYLCCVFLRISLSVQLQIEKLQNANDDFAPRCARPCLFHLSSLSPRLLGAQEGPGRGPRAGQTNANVSFHRIPTV